MLTVTQLVHELPEFKEPDGSLPPLGHTLGYQIRTFTACVRVQILAIHNIEVTGSYKSCCGALSINLENYAQQ
jgi:hypothetical protein